ncbi:acyltransferase [Zunongwangia sp. F363]|uniref:Acyltransferase n=1 Tax=Autumnicola tepida TaxID=3075595 RepID=A0ABU3C7F5_9FLAO|nr:acyltransferase [Zunongwangia sp. F363]MDT0642276.1 acyltransferase [Zunongwangia sp. F363]
MEKNQAIHLTGLNGLRAIASMAVVFSHISLALPLFGLAPLFTDALGNPKGILMASHGVTIFFALSGFLITFLLLKEKEKQKINIQHFYIRRALRIWPLYYLFIAVLTATYFVFGIEFNEKLVPFYIFLAANIPIIINSMLPYMGHLWSIAVEEQFYLFWPWIGKFDNKKLFKFAVVFAAIFYIIKFFLYVFRDDNVTLSLLLTAMNVTRFHIMIIGAIGAIFYYNKSKWIAYFINRKTQVISWSIIALSALNIFNISSALIDSEIIAITTVMIIFSQIMRKNMIIDLDKLIFNFLGKISYGVYVIHPLLIFLVYKIFGEFDHSSFVNYILLYGVIILATIILAYISYTYFERPFIKLKQKFTSIRSSPYLKSSPTGRKKFGLPPS